MKKKRRESWFKQIHNKNPPIFSQVSRDSFWKALARTIPACLWKPTRLPHSVGSSQRLSAAHESSKSLQQCQRLPEALRKPSEGCRKLPKTSRRSEGFQNLRISKSSQRILKAAKGFQKLTEAPKGCPRSFHRTANSLEGGHKLPDALQESERLSEAPRGSQKLPVVPCSGTLARVMQEMVKG